MNTFTWDWQQWDVKTWIIVGLVALIVLNFLFKRWGF